MKKLAIGIFSATLVLGAAGTFALAQEDGNGKAEGKENFGQMKTEMAEMHPDLTTQELKDMYNNCQSEDGMMDDENTENMMNGTEDMDSENMMNSI